MKIRSARFVAGKIWFPFALVLMALFKLWVVHTEEIIGSATEYDALWFVNSAKHWYWNSLYSWSAFVRPPAYPLWIALVHAVHVPQRLAIELLQLVGWTVLVLALRRVAVSRWLCLIAFAVLSLHPASFRYYDYTMADNFYATMLPFLLAGFIGMMFGPGRTYMSILTGLAFAILWNTRDEGVLLVVLLGAWLVLWFWFLSARNSSRSTALRQMSKPIAPFSATAIALIIAVYALNLKTFGAFAKSDMAAPSFQSVIHSLLRIKPDHDRRFVSIPTENFRRAFEISPTFAKLKAQLEGETGESWRIETFQRVGVKDEIGTGWMLWAIREAASRAGVFETPVKAAHFFRDAAREIDRACDQDLVPTRPISGSYLDPLSLTGWKFVPQSFCRIAHVFVARFETGPLADDSILRADQKQVYDEMTLRRSLASDVSISFSSRFEAWIGQNHRFLIWALMLCAAVSVTVLAAQHRQLMPMDGVSLTVLLLGVAILLRVALFTVLDATTFAGDDHRFLIPVMPLFSVMMLLITFQLPRVSQSQLRLRVDPATGKVRPRETSRSADS